jgi:hypothetical protein
MSSPSRRIGWVCSSGPSGSRERRRRSDWRTSSTTSNACSSCGASRRHDRSSLPSSGALNIANTAPVVHGRQSGAEANRNRSTTQYGRVNRSVQLEKGQDKFYSFYRYFLIRLFHEGLGGKARNPELDKLLGRIPYLNGSIRSRSAARNQDSGRSLHAHVRLFRPVSMASRRTAAAQQHRD